MIEYENGEIKSVRPSRIADVINAANAVVVSVRTANGDELTITDVAIDVRPNGVHILLDAPEAVMNED